MKRSAASLAAVLLSAAACGGRDDSPTTPADCPTTTPGAPLPTSVDPRCVIGATETTSAENGTAEAVWKGNVHQVWKNPSCTATADWPAQLSVSADGRFTATVAFAEVSSDCPFPTANLWGSGPLTGQLSADRLIVEGGPTLSGTVPRSGDSVNGSYTNPLPADPNQTYTTTWELRCKQGCA